MRNRFVLFNLEIKHYYFFFTLLSILTHNSWTMYSPPLQKDFKRLVDVSTNTNRPLSPRRSKFIGKKNLKDKFKTCDRCFSITLTIVGADSTFSSASMVNILMRGLLFTVKSAKEDMYSSAMTSCWGVFCASSAILRLDSWISKILPHSPKYIYYENEETRWNFNRRKFLEARSLIDEQRFQSHKWRMTKKRIKDLLRFFNVLGVVTSSQITIFLKENLRE